MIFDKKEIETRHYSILLKNAEKTMVICADKMNKSSDNYEFYIDNNLIVILPANMVENIV